MTPEKRVQNSIIKYLTSLEKDGYPIFFERRQAGGYSYKKGIPDLYAVLNGIHIEIEVKKPGGHLSTMQEKFRDMCIVKNICWICAEDVEQVKVLINTLFTNEMS